jgi:hypothetical protein
MFFHISTYTNFNLLSCVYIKIIVIFTLHFEWITFFCLLDYACTLNLVPIPSSWAKTPFIATSSLFLSLLFWLSKFQLQRSLGCPKLLD